ncbi:hypothetical protein IQ277_28875 [Nostocales cyanobacterium LEGE 12452]|nr:hypothetical protein [Nostocales cyanobacterium LEGE 12452]
MIDSISSLAGGVTLTQWRQSRFPCFFRSTLMTFSTLSKPAQLYWLSGLFGSWQTLRTVHFITVLTVILFTTAHSLLALKVGNVSEIYVFVEVL